MEFLKGAMARARMTPVEQKVHDATNADPWGPHGSVLGEIARLTATPDERAQVMAVLWRRIVEDKPEQWRVVYKALTVIDYLIANGSPAAVEELRASSSRLSALSSFHYKDPDGKDQGINVRHKSANLVQLLNDTDRIAEARAKALANRNKYGGVSAEEMRSGQGGFAACTEPPSSSGALDDEFRIPDAPFTRSSDADATQTTPKYRVNLSSAPRMTPTGPTPRLQLNIAPPTAKPLLPPKPIAASAPTATPAASAFAAPPSASVAVNAASPPFDAFGLLAAAPSSQTATAQSRGYAFAPPPPPAPQSGTQQRSATQPAPSASLDLFALLDAPAAAAPCTPDFASFPLPAGTPAAAPCDPFGGLASIVAPVAPMATRADGVTAPPPAAAPAATLADPFAFAPPLLGVPSAPASSGAMRPAAAALGGGIALGGTPARKPATLDDTVNASLANLGLGQPFAR